MTGRLLSSWCVLLAWAWQLLGAMDALRDFQTEASTTKAVINVLTGVRRRRRRPHTIPTPPTDMAGLLTPSTSPACRAGLMLCSGCP